MISQTFLSIYFWGSYIWFVAGALSIGIPAFFQIVNMLKKDNKSETKDRGIGL